MTREANLSGPAWLDEVKGAVLRPHSSRGGGSALLWDGSPSGSRVVTNHHVVAGQGEVQLAREDGRTFLARVTASDPGLDLALLETGEPLPAVLGTTDGFSRLPAARIGDSRGVRLGEIAFALGHPWGRPWSLTRGVVSGVGEVSFGNLAREFIRSDVRLAPGNSGGPLLNAAGEVIGVNSMVWGGNLGVAIPAHVVEAWLASLARPAARLGVGAANALLAGRQIVILTQVENGGAAQVAGLRVGDVILAANGEAVSTPEALRGALAKAGEGMGDLTLDVWRGGEGRRLLVSLPIFKAA